MDKAPKEQDIVRQKYSINALISIFFIFISIFGLVVLGLTILEIDEFKAHVQTQGNLSISTLEKSVQLRFAAYKLYDDSLNHRLENAFIPFYNAYALSGGDLSAIDLERIRIETGEDPKTIDLYIINSSGVIVATTNHQDLGLDFREKAPLFADYLDSIRSKSGFFPDEVTTEIYSPELRKWAYMPTPDNSYILEIGLKEKNFGIDRGIILNLSEISAGVVQENPFIRNITLWDFKGDKVGSSSDNQNETFDPRIFSLFQSPKTKILDSYLGIPVRYLILIKSDKSVYGYESSFLAQIDFESLHIQKKINAIKLRMIGLFLLVTLITGLLLYLLIHRITLPIKEMIEDISTISDGDLNHSIRDSGYEEFVALGHAIDQMKEKLLDSKTVNLQLLERNEILSRIIESIPEPIFIINTSHQVIGWNRAMEELTGFSRDMMLNADKKDYVRIFYQEGEAVLANLVLDPSLYHLYLHRITGEEDIRSTEGWVSIFGKNSRLYLSAVAAPVLNKEGDVVAVIETVRDQTSLKEAEAAVLKSIKRYRDLLEFLPVGIFEADRLGQITYANQTCIQTFGYTYDEFTSEGFMIHDLVRDQTGVSLDSLTDRILSEGGVVTLELKGIRKGGISFPVLICCLPPESVRSERDIIRGVVFDISERVKVEEALRASEAKYRILVENSQDIIYTLDDDGTVRFLSPSWERYTGIPDTEVIGRKCTEFVHPDDSTALTEVMESVVRLHTRSSHQVFRIMHTDGLWHWYTTVFSPVDDGEAGKMQLSGIAHDISSRKQIEDSLKIALHKLNVLNSITRHDIKNQLTILMGFLHLDIDDLTDPEQIRRNEIERNVGTAIYNQIEFARLYHNIGVHEPVWQKVEGVFKRAAKQLNLSGIQVACSISDLEIYADPMFEKVLYTLLDNSLRHGDHVTAVDLSAVEEKEGLKLVYTDNGAGIRESDKGLIFNHGYGKNTGFGLFLSREILSLTELTIIESGVFGEGVRFEIFVKKGLYRYQK